MLPNNRRAAQHCEIKGMHQAVSMLGCLDEGISYWLCGIDIERRGPDWHETRFTGNVFYPRTLVPAMPDIDGDGRGTPEMTCTDPLDCKNVGIAVF